MTDAADASELTPPQEKAPRTIYQRLAGMLGWVSLGCAALGLLSAMNDLLPTLTRLSWIVHGIVEIYRGIRDWLWDGLERLVRLVGLDVPDIPEVWTDVLAVAALMFAAANLESVRRSGHTFVYSAVKLAMTITTKPEEQWADAFRENALFFPAGIGFFIAMPIGWAILASPLFLWVGYLFGVVSGEVVLVVMVLWLLPRFFVPNFAQIPAFVGVLGALGLIRAWRSVLLAIGIVVALYALNFAFLFLIDPMLREPPDWLRKFIDADPESLPMPPA